MVAKGANSNDDEPEPALGLSAGLEQPPKLRPVVVSDLAGDRRR